MFGDPPEQVHPASMLQLLEHPSPLKVFPSSHGKNTLNPLPHLSVHSPLDTENPFKQVTHTDYEVQTAQPRAQPSHLPLAL